MTHQQLQEILHKDLARFDNYKPGLLHRLFRFESYYIWQYISCMRHLEYHDDKGGLHQLAYWWYRLKISRLQFKLKIAIYPHTIGPGFRLYHVGAYTHVGPNVHIGENCTMVSGVVFGNKTEAEDNRPVIVGDNVYFGIDCKIIGPVKIGNNVSIGANSVVTKDIPDNATVAGVPAKIIRFNNE